jgi:hypothetical protein
LPATRAGISSVIGIANGKFHGEIIATTPPSRRLAGEEISGVEREKYFGENGFGAGLAGLASNDVRDVVAALEDCVAKLAKHCAALSERPR